MDIKEKVDQIITAFYGDGGLDEQELQKIRDLYLDVETRLRQSPGQFVLSIVTTLERDLCHQDSLPREMRPIPEDHIYLSIIGDEGMVVDISKQTCQVSLGKHAHFLKNLDVDNKIDLCESELVFHGLLPEHNWNNFPDPVSKLEFIIGDQEVRGWFFTWIFYDHTIFWKMARLISQPIAEYPELTEELTKKRQEITVKLIGLVNEMNKLTGEDSTSEWGRKQFAAQIKEQLKLAIEFGMAGYTLVSIPGLCQEFEVDIPKS